MQSTNQAAPRAASSAEVVALQESIEERRKSLPPRPDPKPVGDATPKLPKPVKVLTPQQIAARDQQHAKAREEERKAKREALWNTLVGQRGERYEKCTFGNFVVMQSDWSLGSRNDRKVAIGLAKEYARDIEANVHTGKNLILFGPSGTGKDHLLMAVARVATLDHGIRVTWHNGMELFADMRDTFGGRTTEKDFISKFTGPSVLAISDPLPPEDKLTPFQVSLLFRIIDRRYSEMKPTWLTLNVKTKAEAAKRLTPQIHDRLRHGACAVECDWESYRD